MLELNDIQIISKIAKSGSIHLASQHLGISQPALTKRLHAIEERLDVRMFHRQPRGVRLTRLGELFLTRGADLIIHAKDVYDTLQRQKEGDEGSFRLGVKPGVYDAFFRQSLAAFCAQYPKVHIEIVSRPTPVLCDDVKSGRLDLAIVGLGYIEGNGADPVHDPLLNFDALFKLPFDIVVRKDHPILRDCSNLDRLLEYPLACPEPPTEILHNFEVAARRIGASFDGPRILIDDYDFILRLVSSSEFWSGVFRTSRDEIELRNKFECLPGDELMPPMVIGVSYRKSWVMPSSCTTFINIMSQNGAEYRA